MKPADLTSLRTEISRQHHHQGAAAQGQDVGGTPPSALSGGHSSGAPPSNTAPSNYIFQPVGIKILRHGVDSLYLSYPGAVDDRQAARLGDYKLAARGEDAKARACAQMRIGEHVFEVLGKGQGRFPFVLVDNWYRIAVASSCARVLPLAYVQVASALLTSLGVDQAEGNLRFVINSLGRVDEPANISRADLFVDFVSTYGMEWITKSWVTRAQRIAAYWFNREFTGWSIGLGGGMSARLYDKTREILSSDKEYLKPLWEEAGWHEGEQVWRLEFQFKREVLKQLGVVKVFQLSANLGGLWSYATDSWLRLAIPNADDNQSRWPLHPLWAGLSSLAWQDSPAAGLVRVRKERVPSDEALFTAGIGSITSFMAREGITDLGEGFGEFLARADQFHELNKRIAGGGFRDYIQGKVAEKGKRYNTLRNEHPDEQEARKRDADDYRTAKDGE